VGVIKALAQADVRIDCVAGTSGGSIVAVLLAAGKSPEEIQELALGVKWKELAKVTVPRLGFLSSQRIAEFVVDALGDIEFSDLKVPCAIVATNLETGARRVFTTGSVAMAVRASCSIPQIFSPVEINGELYIDGGIVEYLPIQALAAYRPLVTLGVNLGAKRDYVRRPKHIIQLIMQITSVIARQNVARSEVLASYIIRPDLSGYSPFTLKHADEMVQIGYEEMTRHMPSFMALLRREASPWRRAFRRLTAPA
jgi:NTE family protein